MTDLNELGPPIPGQRQSGKPGHEREYFYPCPICGQSVDMRDLRPIMWHSRPGHKPFDLGGHERKRPAMEEAMTGPERCRNNFRAPASHRCVRKTSRKTDRSSMHKKARHHRQRAKRLTLHNTASAAASRRRRVAWSFYRNCHAPWQWPRRHIPSSCRGQIEPWLCLTRPAMFLTGGLVWNSDYGSGRNAGDSRHAHA